MVAPRRRPSEQIAEAVTSANPHHAVFRDALRRGSPAMPAAGDVFEAGHGLAFAIAQAEGEDQEAGHRPADQASYDSSARRHLGGKAGVRRPRASPGCGGSPGRSDVDRAAQRPMASSLFLSRSPASMRSRPRVSPSRIPSTRAGRKWRWNASTVFCRVHGLVADGGEQPAARPAPPWSSAAPPSGQHPMRPPPGAASRTVCGIDRLAARRHVGMATTLAAGWMARQDAPAESLGRHLHFSETADSRTVAGIDQLDADRSGN
jgi:hypothetical protein